MPRRLTAGCVRAVEAPGALQPPSPDSGPTPSQKSPDTEEAKTLQVRTNRQITGPGRLALWAPSHQLMTWQCLVCKESEKGVRCPQMTFSFFFSVHRQQPSRGQHGLQLRDPDNRDASRSPQLLSFIRGTWAREGQVGPAPGRPDPVFLLQPPPSPHTPTRAFSPCIHRGSAATVGVHGGL